MTNPRDQATNTEHDRSVHNAPNGLLVVLNGLQDNLVAILVFGLLVCVLLCAMAWNAATRSAERAFQAQQAAAINREYAVQAVAQLNRMGYPVMSPGEKDHPLALPEDYAKLDAFAKQQQEKQP